ncbi:small ribosomal subunit protein cS23z [Malania oleifera]|uniref:small ribosomal subunit protein cS23z n=1 Tax=Malania oleifera TaxID=397392 RepID=UPI0025AE1775|nr:small ribosomal subunit protein cS23z [Malania oleifera]
MLSMTMHSSGINVAFRSSSMPFRPLKPTIFAKPEALSLHPSSILELRSKPSCRNQRPFTAYAAPEAVTAETPTEDPTPPASHDPNPIPSPEKQKAKVKVKAVEKPRLLLKFIWMEKNIGLALDQLIPGHGTIPLSPYFFWPRKDAWEELKATLGSKPWISQKQMIILLNQATDIINLWQQSGGNLSST